MCFSLCPSYIKVQTAAALVHPVLIPLVRRHRNVHLVEEPILVATLGLRVCREDRYRYGSLCTALPPECVRTTSCARNEELNDHVVPALLPADQITIGQDARARNM